MPKNTETVTEPEYGVPDAENPEWTREEMKRAMRFKDLPPALQRALKRGKRGPQKAPVKQQVTMRLSQDVLTTLRAKGRGWQTLVDDTLRAKFVKP
jgi:uncharacterized protein (DUF4415 family)